MNDEILPEFAAELSRQNQAFAEIEATLRSFGAVELGIPSTFFEELDELTAPRITTPTMPTFGIRA